MKYLHKKDVTMGGELTPENLYVSKKYRVRIAHSSSISLLLSPPLPSLFVLFFFFLFYYLFY